jgi:hypothetical protein
MIDQFRLTPDEQKSLRDMDRKLATIRSTIDSMERIGLDVAEQKERLAQAERIRSGLLQEFGNPIVAR